MMRFAIALALASLVSLNLSAQKNQRPNYKLLWRISGNGLTKPSYLFGTMHAQDKRAFNLNDSVIAKIIQCEAFALEVHPDSATQLLASVILDQDKNQTIESQMTSKKFEYYDSLMKKKTGLSLKKFKTIKEASYFLEQRSLKKDKNTFLDAWLYNIARENGKVMTGLENFRVQIKLLQNTDSTELDNFKKFLNSDFDSDKAMQTMFNFYYEGDVEAIYKYIRSITPEDQFKSIIIDRNVNMTDNIIHEIHQHTLFIAVGAGHLGGEVGIVSLLKKKGYTVSPVTAPFSGTASKYKSTGLAGKWVTFSSEDGRYSVEMPQAPLPLQKKELPVTFQTHFDIGTLTVYMAAHIPLGMVIRDQAASKALDAMIAKMSSSQKVSNVKKITMDGYEGRELEAFADGHVFKVMLTICQSNAHMLMVGPSKESINSADAKRFLSSFKTLKPVNAGIERVVSKEGAFSVDMPGKVTKQVTTPMDPSSGRPVKINLFFSTDNNTGATYIARYNDFPAGYVSTSDSIYIHGILQTINKKMSGVDLSVSRIDFRGYPSTYFTSFNTERTVTVEGVLTLRGERFYMLMNTHANNENAKQAGKDFLDSFRFNPFENPSLKEVSFPQGFALKVPDTFESDSSIIRSADGRNTYSFVDRFSGMMFMVMTESFSKYDQSENADAFFLSIKENYVTGKEGAFVKDSPITGKLPTHEYVLQSEDNSVIRIRSVLAGKSLVSLWVYMPENDHDLILPDQIFNSFTVTPTSDWSLFNDKSDLILKGISTADSTERAEAKSALATHTFKDIHLPKIYEALKKNYDDDDQWNGTRTSLFNILLKIHDNTTRAFIEKIYPTLPDTTLLRDRALAVLNSLKTRQSVRAAADLLATDRSGHQFNSYFILNPLMDSLSLLNDVIPDLLNSLPKFDQKAKLYRAIKEAIDSSAFTTERRNQVISSVTEIATKLADIHENADTDGYHRLVSEKYSVIDLLLSVPFTSQVESIVRKFAAEDDDDNKFLCMQLLLKNNATVTAQEINLLASKPSMRLSVYEELLKYNKHHQIEKKYTTYRMLAESEMFEYLYEDDFPDKIDFLREKNIITNGEKKKIFVFTYGYNGSDDVYAAIAGPYVIQSKEFKRGELTTSFYGEYKNDKELNEKLSEYLSENNAKLVD